MNKTNATKVIGLISDKENIDTCRSLFINYLGYLCWLKIISFEHEFWV